MTGAVVAAVLSTGRCGTHRLTAGLRNFHHGIEVEHEPLGPLYSPRRYVRRYQDPAAILEVPEVRRHVDALETARRPYVETGWPLFPALPLLAQRLGDRLRIVHLTRHPVATALSHLAHGTYAGSPRDDAHTRLAIATRPRSRLRANSATTCPGSILASCSRAIRDPPIRAVIGSGALRSRATAVSSSPAWPAC